jgi:hypothetical protein
MALAVGPSPGKPDPNEPPKNPNKRADKPVYAAIGHQVGKITFGSNARRNGAWNRLTAAFVGDTDRAAALTGVANLDWINSPREKDIKDKEKRLRAGYPDVWFVIQYSKPRIVVALTNEVYRILSGNIPPFTERNFEMPDPPPHRPMVFRIPGFAALSVLCKSPGHPSGRPPGHPSYGFGQNQIAKANAIRNWFIREIEPVRLS